MWSDPVLDPNNAGRCASAPPGPTDWTDIPNTDPPQQEIWVAGGPCTSDGDCTTPPPPPSDSGGTNSTGPSTGPSDTPSNAPSDTPSDAPSDSSAGNSDSGSASAANSCWRRWVASCIEGVVNVPHNGGWNCGDPPSGAGSGWFMVTDTTWNFVEVGPACADGTTNGCGDGMNAAQLRNLLITACGGSAGSQAPDSSGSGGTVCYWRNTVAYDPATGTFDLVVQSAGICDGGNAYPLGHWIYDYTDSQGRCIFAYYQGGITSCGSGDDCPAPPPPPPVPTGLGIPPAELAKCTGSGSVSSGSDSTPIGPAACITFSGMSANGANQTEMLTVAGAHDAGTAWGVDQGPGNLAVVFRNGTPALTGSLAWDWSHGGPTITSIANGKC